MADKTKNPFDKFVKKLDPKTRKKLRILFPDTSKKVIHIKKTPLTVTSPVIRYGLSAFAHVWDADRVPLFRVR